jgi:alcohol dehydrogenase
VYTNGGGMADYRGVNTASKPMLPMIGVPTTAGTGSEAQSFALISDAVTHQKMACGDVKAACRVAILDSDLTLTQPPDVAAAAAMDAVAHTVETVATTKRNEVSLTFSMEAWARLNGTFERAMSDPRDDAARADMLLGAHLAGAAIERSMLGAAHSCANPLTARLGIRHGVAVGVMLPHVVRFNAREGDNPYRELEADADRLAERLEAMLDAARLPRRLRDLQVPEDLLPDLAREAAEQWTAAFNPRPVGRAELLTIYRSAFG